MRRPSLARILCVLAGLASAVFAAADAFGREGVRLGDWKPGPLPLWPLLPALVLLALGLPPRTSRRPGALALALGLALGVLVTVAATRPTWPVGGALRARVRALTTGEGEHVRLMSLERLRTPAAAAEALGRRVDVDVELAGFLHVPATGRYRLDMRCGGACSVWLDGHELLRGPDRVGAEWALAAGPAELRITLQQSAARGFVSLDWDTPAFVEAESLAERVSSERGQAVRPTRTAVRMARGLFAALAGLVAAGSGFALLRAGRAALPGALTALRTRSADPVCRHTAVVGLAAVLFLAALHLWIAARALPGGYLHPWTSEYMMQTVSAADLRVEPLRSLFYLHIQPPLFDAVRAALVALHAETLEGEALLRAVDRGLYYCWGLAYGLAVALVHLFLAQLVRPRAALAGAALFALHPAALFYATFLDSTFVSALLVSWVGYELWRMGPGRGSSARLSLAVIALFLARSLVQWPFLLVLASALALRGVDRGRVGRVLLVVGGAMGLLIGKQYALFGLNITSSLGPDSFCKGLSAYCAGTTPAEPPHELPPPAAASALRRTAKLNGEYNYNQLAFVRRSFSQMREYRALLRATSPTQLARLMAHNLGFWLKPSSHHSAHVLADALPWRPAFDVVMSGIPLLALLALSTTSWLRAAWPSRAEIAAGLGLALPALYVAATSIVFESGENMRYKFFVEPLLFVFFWTQACATIAALRAHGRRA